MTQLELPTDTRQKLTERESRVYELTFLAQEKPKTLVRRERFS